MNSFPNLEPVGCFTSSSNCCFLACIQVSQEAGKVVWYSHLFKNFPQFVEIHMVKDFSVVSEAHVFWNSLGYSMIQQILAIWPLVPLPFWNPACTSWKFPVHLLLKPSLKDFEHNLGSMWNEHNCAVVWTCFGIALLWDWDENWPSQVLWALLIFPNLLTYWPQHFNSIIF